MSIEWSESAVADYDAILDYIVRDFGTTVASEFQSKLDHNISILSEFPLAGQAEYINPITKIEYRSLSCKQYKIVYAPLENRLIIVSLWDNRRNPDTLRRILSETR